MQKRGFHWFEMGLILVVMVFHVYASLAPANNMMAWYSTDDAFYYFKVAQNISEGYGSTFDRIALTNGYHPLWLLVCVPVFSLARFDLVLPLRVLILVLAAFNAATAVLLYRTVKLFLSETAAMLAAAFWALSPVVHGTTVEMGVESGINAFTLVLLVYLIACWEKRRLEAPFRYRDFAWISLASILALFSRLDNVFIVFVIGLWLVLRAWNLVPQGSDPWRHRFLAALAYFIPLGIALSSYMGWNYIVFGTPTPVSGQIKRWWGTLPNTVYGFPVTNFWIYLSHWITRDSDLGPWSMFFNSFHVAAGWIEMLAGIVPDSAGYKWTHRLLVFSNLVIFSVLAGGLVWANRGRVRRAAARFSLAPLLIGCALQITSYKATPYISERSWYWVPEMVWLVLAGAILVESLVCLLQRVKVKDVVMKGAAWLAVALMLVQFGSFLTTMVPWKDDPKWTDAYLWGAEGLEAVTEPGSLIGTPGGGSLAYFIQNRTIINLDGLMNSYAYFQMMKAGKARQYLEQIGLDYAYANKYMLTESDPYWPAFKDHVIFMDKIVGTSLFQYVQISNP